jgi:hypothetical protein
MCIDRWDARGGGVEDSNRRGEGRKRQREVGEMDSWVDGEGEGRRIGGERWDRERAGGGQSSKISREEEDKISS